MYRQFLEAGELPMRVDLLYRLDQNLPLDELKEREQEFLRPGQSFGDGMIRIDGIKMGLDGAERSAVIHLPARKVGKPAGKDPVLLTIFAKAAIRFPGETGRRLDLFLLVAVSCESLACMRMHGGKDADDEISLPCRFSLRRVAGTVQPSFRAGHDRTPLVGNQDACRWKPL